jgi:hypothetical protein
MKLISHRGNISGAKPLIENDPLYIRQALEMGFDVEVDVRSINGNYILGHDSADYFIKESFLENKKLWCHAKNLEAIERMVKNKKIHCFWHQNDDYTLTSKGYIWTYPGKKTGPKSIVAVPEYKNKIKDIKKFNCFGICSDFVLDYK